MEKILKLLNRMDSLATIMQESAEIGDMDSSVYVDLLEMLSDLIAEMRKDVTA